MVEITLDSKNVTKDNLFDFRVFLGDLSLADLLLITKVCENESGERIETLYEIRMGIAGLNRTEI